MNDFVVLVCDGCGGGAPLGSTRAEVRALAVANGWTVDVGPDSEDYCAGCRHRIPEASAP